VQHEPDGRLLRQRGDGGVLSTLKTELADHFDSHGEAKRELFEYIDAFYNTRRRHSALDYVSRAEYERRFWSARNEQCA